MWIIAHVWFLCEVSNKSTDTVLCDVRVFPDRESYIWRDGVVHTAVVDYATQENGLSRKLNEEVVTLEQWEVRIVAVLTAHEGPVGFHLSLNLGGCAAWTCREE